MQNRRHFTLGFHVIAVALLIAAHGGPSAAQQPLPPAAQASPGLAPLGSPDSMDPASARMAAARTRLMNDDRHKRLMADTDKLVQLATELQAAVAKAGKDELSVDVVRKADQMEKLAHDVKERMKN